VFCGKPAFAIGPQTLSLETENVGRGNEEAQVSLNMAAYEEAPGTLSLGVLC